MRIIAGEHRGRRIAAPPGQGTRPMLDRVREALFSRLHPWLPDARVLDLFAGSGSLGLEALSRGAARARLVELDAAAFRLLEGNVRSLGLDARAEPVHGDALEPRAWAWDDGGFASDVVFVDAPYLLVREGPSRSRLLGAARRLALEHLAEGGVLVLHVPRGALGPGAFGPALAAESRTYGTNDLWFVSARGAGEDA